MIKCDTGVVQTAGTLNDLFLDFGLIARSVYTLAEEDLGSDKAKKMILDLTAIALMTDDQRDTYFGR